MRVHVTRFLSHAFDKPCGVLPGGVACLPNPKRTDKKRRDSMKTKFCQQSRSVHADLVLPSDTNNHNTLFGGVLMKYIDAIAALSAIRHCRTTCVTASIDSIDFLCPITPNDSICLESYVSWTGKTSMEVFVKVIAEKLTTGERKIAATSFLTFVAVDVDGKPIPVPQVIPESEEEKMIHEAAPHRAKMRKEKREKSKEWAGKLTTEK
jgi:acyl-CoA hydrolase